MDELEIIINPYKEGVVFKKNSLEIDITDAELYEFLDIYLNVREKEMLNIQSAQG